ncbi:hypothetical protein KC367_g186 [Hortaea werneckii]|nr:hypothetical protein KC367_g186 [Hortaea werneckii]
MGLGIITRASSRVIRWRSSQKVARNFFESEMQTLARAPTDAACLNLSDHQVDHITSLSEQELLHIQLRLCPRGIYIDGPRVEAELPSRIIFESQSITW